MTPSPTPGVPELPPDQPAGEGDSDLPGRIPELEQTRINARYWLKAGRNEPDRNLAVINVEQSSNAWMNAAYAMADRAIAAESENASLRAEADAKQAQIDRLMLEFCPNEMTPEQVAEWGRNQRAAGRDGGERG